MEDQQAGPGDLTSGAVPQGKAARRHRLSRRELRQAQAEAAPEAGQPEAASPEAVSPEIETSETGAPEAETPVNEVPVSEVPVSADAPEASEEPQETVAPTETAAETQTPEATSTETQTPSAEPAAKPATAEPAKTRRRFGWGRKKAAPAAPIVTETSDAVSDPSPLDTAPADAAPADTTPASAAPAGTTPVDTTSAEDVAAAPADEIETDVVTTAAVADTTVAPEADDDEPGSTEDAESTETSETSQAPESAEASEADEAPEPVLVPHRTAGRALKVAAAAAGVLVVGAAAFAGAALQPYLADRAEVQTKFEIAKVSADAITTLWTYTPEDMDTLPDRAARYLGGDFATDYRRYIDSIVSTNKQAQVSNVTQVMGTAVEDLSPTEATALVYTNSVATSPVTKGIPSLRYLSYRLGLRLEDRKWRITQMQAVTSLDLTPRL